MPARKTPATPTTARRLPTMSSTRAPAARTKKTATKTKAATKKAATKKTATKKTATKKTAAKKAAKKVAKKVAVKKAAVKKTASAAKAASAAVAGTLVNHVAFVVDRSGSMSSLATKVVDVFNAQLQAVKENAKVSGQESFVSYYTFHSKVDAPKFFAKPVAKVPKLTKLSCTGLTALYDATGQAIVDLEGVKGAGQDNVSFLVVILTDGHENASKKYKSKIKAMIGKAQKTGRWTFAFLVPRGGASVLKKFGIPDGNIQVWNTTAKGVADLGKSMRRGLDTFYAARGQGQRSVKGVFTTNLKGLTAQQVSAALVDEKKAFKRFKVEADVDIQSFVNAQLKGKGTYTKGHGFYELTKPETVQAAKDIAIVDQKGAVFTGPAARDLLGLPKGASCKVKPGDHGDFKIFIASTSLNRKLVKGTELLYRV
jgi:Mg-chelatase subunit ChlD